MTPFEVVFQVNEEFEYTRDPDQYKFSDVWRIMKPGQMQGDCEDYALTILWMLAGKKRRRMLWWLITRKAKLHFYRHEERGSFHAGLQFKDRFVDNISRRWNDGTVLEAKGYRRLFRFPLWWIGVKALISAPFIVFQK